MKLKKKFEATMKFINTDKGIELLIDSFQSDKNDLWSDFALLYDIRALYRNFKNDVRKD